MPAFAQMSKTIRFSTTMTVQFSPFALQCDVAPQAIFWRPMEYFSSRIRTEQDDLDNFRAASFVIGNYAQFELRHYAGHPPKISTLYLPLEISEISQIIETIETAVIALSLPLYAMAWRRGWDFKFGKLTRRQTDRLIESEARTLALKIASQCKNHSATTEYIKGKIPEFIELSPRDLMQSTSRRREKRWQQIVGNVISHQRTPLSPFSVGYAARTRKGLTVTPKGLDYLNSIGFSV